MSRLVAGREAALTHLALMVCANVVGAGAAESHDSPGEIFGLAMLFLLACASAFIAGFQLGVTCQSGREVADREQASETNEQSQMISPSGIPSEKRVPKKR